MNMKRLCTAFILSAFLAIVLVSSGLAQTIPVNGGLNADGRDYYIGLLYPSYNSQGPIYDNGNVLGFYGVYALVTSYNDNVVTVSYFDTISGKEHTGNSYKLKARMGMAIPLNVEQMKMADNGEIPEYRACHITAKQAINVQYFSTGSCSGGSYLAIPTNALGKKYVVESYHDNVGGVGGLLSNEDAAGYCMVIAVYDNTTVSITPTSTTKGGHVGVGCGNGATGQPAPFSVTLNRGQCYMVKSAAKDASCDLSGTTILCDKPAAVLGGHENAFTDGSDPSPGGTSALEARDYMVEQMLPVEYWDTTGLISIPLADSQLPARDGEGDEYKIFCGVLPESAPPPPLVTKGVFDKAGFPAPFYPIDEAPHANPIPNQLNVTTPACAYSTNGAKIHMVLYDQRMQGAAAPFPAPSQMTIIPQSLWKTSYLWYVPANTFESQQGYYINLICNRDDYNKQRIKLAFNAGKLQPIQSSGLSVHKLFNTMGLPSSDGYDSLMGVQYGIGYGSYYCTGDAGCRPFVIYNYGFRAIDPNRDLGDFCGDDHFFAYALPVGFKASSDSGALSVVVDTECAKWHLHIHDGRPFNPGQPNPGIASVQILNDPFGDVVRIPGTSTGYVGYNVNFDPALDPNTIGEIDYPGTDTTIDLDIFVTNPLDTAFGPIYVLDNSGNGLLFILKYKAPKLGDTAIPPQVAVMGTTRSLLLDSVVFPPTRVCGDTVCATVMYINFGKPNVDQNVQIDSVVLTKLNDSNFTLINTIPAIDPVNHLSLKPGDTLRVNICFHPTDTTTHKDTLILGTQCFKAPVPIIGPGGTPLLLATDKDFGPVVVGDSKCDTVTVRNVGNMPVTITSQLLHDNVNFSYNASNIPLPLVLQPGQAKTFTFCFHPTTLGPDSTTNDWLNDITCQFEGQIKPWSYLKGVGLKPGLIWDRQKQFDTTVCDNPDTVLVNLINNTGSPTTIRLVYFGGPDSAQYKIIDDKFHLNPLEQQFMNPHETTYVVYVFTPDLTQTPKFADRHAQLIASYYTDNSQSATDSTVIDMTGTVLYPAIMLTPVASDLGTIAIGQTQAVFVTICDTGTAPYTITENDFTPPLVAMKLDTSGTSPFPLGPGFTILPGQCVQLELDGRLDAAGDTTVPFTLFDNIFNCANNGMGTMHIAASNSSLLSTGWPAPDTYINCRQNKSTIRVTNTGSAGWRLDSVVLAPTSGGTGLPEFDLIDSATGNFAHSLYPNRLLGKGQFMNIGAIFHPIHLGPDTVQVFYYLDSAGTGKKDTILVNLLTGNGIGAQTTLTALNNAGSAVPGYYVAQTGSTFVVPIRLDVDTLPVSADARRVTFDVSFKQDLFSFVSADAGPYAFTTAPVVSAPNTNPGADANTTVSFDVTNQNGPITNLGIVANMTLLVRVTKDEVSNFTISNVKYYDVNGNQICYIITDTVPGPFVETGLCGDSTVRSWLQGVLPTKIVSLKPNPASQLLSPILDYIVTTDGTPLKVEIYNILGQVVRTIKSTDSQPAGEYKLPIGTLGLESGTYDLRISTPHSSQSARFILQN